ncbi:hypothetical protein [Anabaena sp. UHCC 0399]|uniref:hypothetical protein n=1 Tax=Anabaena sp. UHCC 0399 TaxID=3110238 RepID=UPI002B210DBD|nr:hypothetical protein [Anabaena sp. UHCC 0399]MEA5567241.1 hypothetical protein [Anabaena sp. UHCC 0399]
MLSQTIATELLTDLSTDEQQLLSGGRWKRYKGGCGMGSGGVGSAGVGGTGVDSEDGEEPTCPALPTKARMVIGHIITVKPFAKCLNGGISTGNGMED